MQCAFILLAFTTHPFLHQNKPPRESIICDKVGDWWAERALIMLKFLLKTRQNNNSVVCTHMGNGTENTYTYNRQRKRLQGLTHELQKLMNSKTHELQKLMNSKTHELQKLINSETYKLKNSQTYKLKTSQPKITSTPIVLASAQFHLDTEQPE